MEAVTNDNLIINVFNKLDEPFLLSWYVRAVLPTASPPLSAPVPLCSSFVDPS